MKLFDSHCHLYMEPLSEDIEGVLIRANASSVTDILVPAFDRGSFGKVIELTSRPGIHGALGLHPWCAAENLTAGELEGHLSRSGIGVIGEIGLDFKVKNANIRLQKELFHGQLQVAVKLGLPVILHCRGAFEEILDILGGTEFRGRLRGVVHAFSRGPQLAARFLDLGFHLAFGGAVTRHRARRARSSAAYAPVDMILLETDAPSIGMEGIDPCETEPAHLLRVAEALALPRGVTASEIAELTDRNARSLFGIDVDD